MSNYTSKLILKIVLCIILLTTALLLVRSCYQVAPVPPPGFINHMRFRVLDLKATESGSGHVFIECNEVDGDDIESIVSILRNNAIAIPEEKWVVWGDVDLRTVSGEQISLELYLNDPHGNGERELIYKHNSPAQFNARCYSCGSLAQMEGIMRYASERSGTHRHN